MYLQGVHGLIDSSADQDVIDGAVKACLGVDGVIGVRSIRARRMGQKNGIDMVIDVSDRKTVLDTHTIGEKVKEAIVEKVRAVSHIQVHCFPVRETIVGKLFGESRRPA
jgi:divalent metal cation (Fe/Co/Zn/Cd) transporter